MRKRTVGWCGWTLLVLPLAFVATPSVLSGQEFNPEMLVSSGAGLASSPALTLDVSGNVYVTWIENGEVLLAAGILPQESFTLTDTGLMHDHPGVAVDSQGVVTVVFQREDLGGEIYYISNPGGNFGSPVNLSQSPFVDRVPRISTSSPAMGRNILWLRDDAAPPTVWLSQNLGLPMAVAAGSAASHASYVDKFIHLAYEREEVLYYRLWDPNGVPPLGAEITIFDESPIDGSAISVDADGTPRLVFSRDGDVFYVLGDGSGGFLPAVNLSSSGAASTRPQIAYASQTGVDHVVFEEDGDLWATSRIGGVSPRPQRITNTPAVESPSRLEAGIFGYCHVVFARDGDTYYMNNVPAPVASFLIDPPQGEVPLEILFTNTSKGVIASSHWDFGDGSVSVAARPTHLYEEPGTYEVTLTVSGPGGTDAVSHDVEVLEASNSMRVPDLTLFSGQPNAWVPVLATHADPVQGFQVAARWDCDILHVSEVTLDSTDLSALAPDFFAATVVDDGVDCHLTVGVVIETSLPVEGLVLPPGEDQRILNLILSVNLGAPAPTQTVLDLDNNLGLINVFTVQGVSVVPAITDGTMTVVPFAFPPPTLFVRGDFNNDGSLSLPDGFGILAYLFVPGAANPVCIDAADVDDSGALGLPDAFKLLNFIFLGGSIPPFPYPSPGLDPTPDPLGEC